MPRTRIFGGVRSRLRPVTATAATPPSAAVIVRVTDLPAPLRVSRTVPGHERVSGAPFGVQVKWTAIGLRYHPACVLRCALVTRAVMLGSRRAVDADQPVKSRSPA